MLIVSSNRTLIKSLLMSKEHIWSDEMEFLRRVNEIKGVFNTKFRKLFRDWI